MWREVMNEIPTTDEVRQTVMNSKGKAAQRTHCAALARFVAVCAELKQEWKELASVDQLQHILVKVLDWSGKQGAKLYWLKKMRTAISVLYDYKFNQQIADSALVKTVIHAYAIKQPPVKQPLRLKWTLPQLMQHIDHMGSNTSLTNQDLTKKCITLLLITTCARFTEIEQFSMNGSDPDETDSKWDFIVKIKNREYRQPVELHGMKNVHIDPIIAMKELRRRIRQERKGKHRQEDTFWYTKEWTVMTETHLRQAALHLLQDAGIADNKPYHIKHATITWLKKKGISADEIRRLARHAPTSTVYLENYLSEDMGIACNEMIEKTMWDDDSERNCVNPEEKGGERKGGSV
jgi:site-specific recombinase XerD